MLVLLKNLDVYSPGRLGKNDMLLCGEKIYKIQPNIKCENENLFEEVFDYTGCFAFPGLIDQHVHISGGGGEKGFASRISVLPFEQVVKAGVTTLVGLLGADNVTKNLEGVYAHAKCLEINGLTTFIYSGCYSVPSVTLTGDTVRDMVLIDKVIGIGEIAISDARSSDPSFDSLIKMTSDAYLGGLISGKAGVSHFHVGDGKKGLAPLHRIIEHSDLPLEQLVPTHLNRNPALFEEAVGYCKNGGNIDLTSGEKVGIPVPDALAHLISEGMDISRVTFSSDGNAGTPGGETSSILSLLDDIISCVKDKAIPPETAFRPATENVAKILKLYPKKGTLQPGSDADILILNENYEIRDVFCRGKSCAKFLQ